MKKKDILKYEAAFLTVLFLATIISGCIGEEKETPVPTTAPATTAAPTTAPPTVEKGTLQKISETGEIVIGHREDAVPFAFVDEKGNIVGFSVDMGKLLAERLSAYLGKDIKIKVVPVTAQTRVPMVQNSQIDISMECCTITKSRDEVVDFSLPYFLAETFFMVRKDSGIKSLKDLDGKIVGATRGTTNLRALEEAIDEGKLNPKDVVITESHSKGFMALSTKMIDAYFTDSSLLAGLKSKAEHPEDYEIIPESIHAEPYGFVIRENDSDFKDFVNNFIIWTLLTGKFDEIYDTWMGPEGITPIERSSIYEGLLEGMQWPGISENWPEEKYTVSAPPTVKGTLQKISETGEIVIGHREDAVPFAFVDEKGNIVGFSVDMGKLLAERLSAYLGKDIKIKVVPVTAQTRVPMVQNSQIDISMECCTITKSRDEVVDFSLPYFLAETFFMVRKDSGIKSLKDLDGKIVGATRGTTNLRALEEAIDEGKLNPKDVVITESHSKGFMALSTKMIDAYFTDSSLLAGLKSKAEHPEDYEIIPESIHAEPYGFVIRENDSDFKDFVNNFIIWTLLTGKFDEIYDTWMGPEGITPIERSSIYEGLLEGMQWPGISENWPEEK